MLARNLLGRQCSPFPPIGMEGNGTPHEKRANRREREATMSCLVKRSQFLRGRNLTRDSQADGAPTALLGPAPYTDRGASFFPRQSDTGAHASKNPGVWGRAPGIGCLSTDSPPNPQLP